MIGEILIRIFFSEEAMGKQVQGTKLSLAIADFTTTMFKRSRAGLNIIMELFLKENVTKVNFTKEDKRLETLIDDIRVIILEIIQKRLNEPDHTERDFIQDYITQMKEVDAKIA